MDKETKESELQEVKEDDKDTKESESQEIKGADNNSPIEPHEKQQPTQETTDKDELNHVSQNVTPTPNTDVESENKGENGEGVEEANSGDTTAKTAEKPGKDAPENITLDQPAKVENEENAEEETKQEEDKKSEEVNNENEVKRGEKSEEINKQVSSENEVKVGEEVNKQVLSSENEVKDGEGVNKQVLRSESEVKDGEKSQEVKKEVRKSENEVKVEEGSNHSAHKQPMNLLARIKHSFGRVKNALIRNTSTKHKPYETEEHKPTH